MSGSDLSVFIGQSFGIVAPLALAVTVGALITLGVLAGIVSFVDSLDRG